MTKYITILVVDEDDTPKLNKLSLREFLSEIDTHVNNVKGAILDSCSS